MDSTTTTTSIASTSRSRSTHSGGYDDGLGVVRPKSARFALKKEFLDRYERHIVGAREHEEYWLPAEELEALNDAIVGEIEVIAAFGTSQSADHVLRRMRWFGGYCHVREVGSVYAQPPAGTRVACPCCHCLTLDARADYDICPVCFWEDDGQDEHDRGLVRGGPNGPLSLTAARENYARIGAVGERALPHVRAPREEEGPRHSK